MDPDPNVKRLHCLHDRRQTENQATSQWMGWIWNFRFFCKCTVLPFSFIPSQNNISRIFFESLWKLQLFIVRQNRYNLNNTHQHAYLFYFSDWSQHNFDAWFLLLPILLNPSAGIFVWKNVQGEIRCFTAIIANKIISTSGRTQYCTNMTPSHPPYDGVTTQILSVNMNWTTRIHRIDAWRASDSTAAISVCVQMQNKHALAYTFSSEHWILLCQWWLNE